MNYENSGVYNVLQTFTTITSDILLRLECVLENKHPDLVLVHGDTTTSMAAALASFYKQILMGHVEAGLRTGEIYSLFSEEMNRTLISRIATYHFAPTEGNRRNLFEEGVKEGVYVTGNTVIDAFKKTIKNSYKYKNGALNSINVGEKCILVTAHRRENLGEPLENICKAIFRITNNFSDVQVIYPVHLNLEVRNCVYKYLGNHERIFLN